MTPTLTHAMRLCVVQHHPLETPGYVLSWAQARGMQVQVIHAWTLNQAGASNLLPKLAEFDALVVLGGPYSVSDTDSLPWLAQEIIWLKRCVHTGIPIFAICLGAQLLAHCLGAKVESMAAQNSSAVSPDRRDSFDWDVTPKRDSSLIAELGWVDATFCAGLVALGSARAVLQWHEDTFHLPPGAELLAHSAAGKIVQGFSCGNKKMGVQFHPEWSASTFARLIDSLATPETTAHLRSALTQTTLFDTQEALCMALLDFWRA